MTERLLLKLAGIVLVGSLPRAGYGQDGYPQLVAAALESGCIDKQKLASAIQSSLHPTGDRPTAERITATPEVGNASGVSIDVATAWFGGFLGTRYMTEIRWTFGRGTHSQLMVTKDTAAISSTQETREALARWLTSYRDGGVELCVTRLERDVAKEPKGPKEKVVAAAGARMESALVTEIATKFSAAAVKGDRDSMRRLVEAPFGAYGVGGATPKEARECALEGGGLFAKTPKDLEPVLNCAAGVGALPLADGWEVTTVKSLAADPAFSDYKSGISKMPADASVAVTSEWGDCRHATAIVVSRTNADATVRGVFSGSFCPPQ